MKYISYTKGENHYEFVDEKGNKTLIPCATIILVDDGFGTYAIKLTATRKTIGCVNK